MRMALWNVFQHGFRSSQWNWTSCGLWGGAWCAPEVIKAQPFQKVITLGSCLLAWSSPSPCRVPFSSALMAEGPMGSPVSPVLCAAGAEPCVWEWLSSVPCSKGWRRCPCAVSPQLCPSLRLPLPLRSCHNIDLQKWSFWASCYGYPSAWRLQSQAIHSQP